MNSPTTAIFSFVTAVIQIAVSRLLVLGLLLAMAPVVAQSDLDAAATSPNTSAQTAGDNAVAGSSDKSNAEANGEAGSDDGEADASQSSQNANAQLSPEREDLLTRELADRQAAIQELQSDYGVYTPDLMEAYYDLGTLYLELGEPENAARIFNDAL